MHRRLNQAALGTTLLTLLACSGGGDSKAPTIVTGTASSPSSTMALFDPANGKVPLPNVLATATAPDPLTAAYTSHTTGATVAGARPANTSMTPPEALAYVNTYEMGSTHAVSGMNAPIYIQFTAPVDPTTVNAANIKVFQLTPDAAGTENSALGFTDISATFRYSYAAGGTDLLMFPNFPLLPGTRYLYVVTNRVMDTGTPAKPISDSPFFEALKSTTTLAGSFAALEAIRADVTASSQILLSGYKKVMDDLIAASATTTITKRDDITLMGRFITTAAGAFPVNKTAPSASGATNIPTETALRAFAFGSANPLNPLLAGKTWTNTITVSSTYDRGGTNPSPDAYWTAVMGTATAAPATVGTVVLGSFASADLNIDPVVAKANAATMNLTGITGAYNPAAGVTQAFRASGNAMGFYHTDRTVPFVYIAPTGTAPTGGWPLVIFQHGITSQKETIIATAQSFTAVGRAVVAIDMPLHGALAVPTHTTGAVWGQDFMAIGAPLATRTNLQQAAFNLNRLELTIRGGAWAAVGAAAPSRITISYLGHSLGAIVGAYYLAGNTSLALTGAPYTQTTLNSDMKGMLANPGARLTYAIQNSASFGPSVDAGLAASGIVKNSPTYHQFFLVTQAVVDPADPASLTTPLAAGLPSRLSNRVLMTEATTLTFSATAVGSDGLPSPTDGDLTIPNPYTRYFGAALGGREVLGTAGAALAPGFKQLAYTTGGTPSHASGVVGTPFLFTLSGSTPTPKVGNAAIIATATTPTEGYFQFDQTGVAHSSLLSPTTSATATGLMQKQMRYFLGITGTVVDPTQGSPSLPIVVGPQAEVQVPQQYEILGH